jgi:predicted MFS family arabinose efflux permease
MDSAQRTVVALGAQFFANGFIYATFVARLSEVRDQAGVSTAGLGLTLSAGSLVALGASFFTGMAIRRAGSKPLLVASGKICGGGIRHLGLACVVFLVLTEKNSEADVDS